MCVYELCAYLRNGYIDQSNHEAVHKFSVCVCAPGSSRQGVGTGLASSNFAASDYLT